MKHLGTSPEWVEISQNNQYPKDMEERYKTILSKNISSFELNFSHDLQNRHFDIKNIVVQPRGLQNPGLMCFANSAIQLLLASPYFISFVYFMQNFSALFTPKMVKLAPTWILFCKFLRDFKLAESTDPGGQFTSLKVLDLGLNQLAEPTSTKVLDAVFGPFASTRHPKDQEDANEFLSYFLGRLHDELLQLMKISGPIDDSLDHSGPWKAQDSSGRTCVVNQTQGERSPLSDIFGTLTRVTTSNGAHVSMANESYFLIPLKFSPGDEEPLEDIINKFLAKSYTEGGKTTHSSFLSLPKSLILGLSRAYYNVNMEALLKNEKMVIYPEVLNLSLIGSQKTIKYTLGAIVEHIGRSPAGGHYICIAKRFDGQWIKFDDAKMSKMNEAHLGLQAYMLLYNQVSD